MGDHFSISLEFYDAHEMEFFIIMNSVSKFASELDEATVAFRTFVDKMKSGSGACHSNFARFMSLEVIKCLWSSCGTEKFPAFAASEDL